METSQLLAKANPPTWLKILVISLIGLGIFFRFAHLGQKVYWFDEAFTSIAISGHTVPQLQQEVINEHVSSVAILDKYQHINPDRGVGDTVSYLMISDPQHPPLYYVMARLWAQVFGDSPAGVRSLSAAIGLLIFPSVYWLCLELFESKVVGWVAIAIMAVSPLEIFFAQEARPYCLWMVTILVSSAALLRAIRRETRVSWAMYALTLALGFYTHLFTVLVAIAHGIYVAFRDRFRFNKTLLNYILATTVACLMFFPWLIVFLTNKNIALQQTSWALAPLSSNPLLLIGIWLSRISRIFFDINLGSETYWFDSLASESPLLYNITSIIFCLLFISYLIYFFSKNASRKTSLFVGLLGGVPGLSMLSFNLIFGGIHCIYYRYQLPLFLSIQIAVAYVLAFYLFLEKTGQQKVGQFMMLAFLIAGLFSDVSMFRTENWWVQTYGKTFKEAAQLINQSESPLLVSSEPMSSLGIALTLSHSLEPKVPLLPVHLDHHLILPQEYKNIFILDVNNTFIQQIQQDKTYSIKVIDPHLDFWQIEKIK